MAARSGQRLTDWGERGSEIRCFEPFADDLDHLRPAVGQDVVTCLVGTDHLGLRNIDDEPAEGAFVCLAGGDKKDGEARLAYPSSHPRRWCLRHSVLNGSDDRRGYGWYLLARARSVASAC